MLFFPLGLSNMRAQTVFQLLIFLQRIKAHFLLVGQKSWPNVFLNLIPACRGGKKLPELFFVEFKQTLISNCDMVERSFFPLMFCCQTETTKWRLKFNLKPWKLSDNWREQVVSSHCLKKQSPNSVLTSVVSRRTLSETLFQTLLAHAKILIKPNETKRLRWGCWKPLCRLLFCSAPLMPFWVMFLCSLEYRNPYSFP